MVFRWFRSTQVLTLFMLCASTMAAAQVADDASFTFVGPPDPNPVPHSMGALGDSMSAGLFANYKRQDFIYPFSEIGVVFDLIDFLLTGEHLSAFENPATLSWATGLGHEREVYSHAGRIWKYRHYQNSEVNFFNGAVSGAESVDLDEQIARMKGWANSTMKRSAPDYVTLLIGANDICGEAVEEMTPTAQFQNTVRGHIQRILASDSRTRIMVSSLPNIEKIRAVAYNARLSFIPFVSRCYKFWEAANLCPTLTLISDPQQRNEIAARVIEYNDALQQMVTEEAQAFGDRVRFAPQTYQVEFNANDLALDCFHPNRYGQQKIADAVWQSSWWKNRIR